MEPEKPQTESESESAAVPAKKKRPPKAGAAEEIGGPKGPEPTRYGDWEQKGRCTDF